MSFSLIALVALALVYSYLNGVHDASTLVSTMISSRAMDGRTALLLTAAAMFIGPFLLGVAVANTIGSQVVDAGAVKIEMILAALLSAVAWEGITWFLGIPSSASHALVGGLVGAVWAGAGLGAIQVAGLAKVLIALFASPLAGLLAGYLITQLVFLLAWNATPRINTFFKRIQALTCTLLAFSCGANDAQKMMGVITLGLMAGGALQAFSVPRWVVLVSALGLALGAGTGGWSLIRTLGAGFFKIKPVDGFCSQMASDLIVIGVSLAGGPVSTTQVVSTSVMGVGAAERINKVRWNVAQEIALAWLVTIPATALLAVGLYWLIVLMMKL